MLDEYYKAVNPTSYNNDLHTTRNREILRCKLIGLTAAYRIMQINSSDAAAKEAASYMIRNGINMDRDIHSQIRKLHSDLNILDSISDLTKDNSNSKKFNIDQAIVDVELTLSTKINPDKTFMSKWVILLNSAVKKINNSKKYGSRQDKTGRSDR